MKQNSRGAALLIPLLFLASVTALILSFFIIQNSQKTQKSNQAIPTIDSTTRKAGYYPEFGKRNFTLQLDNSCQEDLGIGGRGTKIECITEDYKVVIKPEALPSSFGPYYQPIDIRSGELNLNNREWSYKLWLNEDQSANAVYKHSDPDVASHYFIEVEFYKYNKQSFQYVNQILSTFQFVE